MCRVKSRDSEIYANFCSLTNQDWLLIQHISGIYCYERIIVSARELLNGTPLGCTNDFSWKHSLHFFRIYKINSLVVDQEKTQCSADSKNLKLLIDLNLGYLLLSQRTFEKAVASLSPTFEELDMN